MTGGLGARRGRHRLRGSAGSFGAFYIFRQIVDKEAVPGLQTELLQKSLVNDRLGFDAAVFRGEKDAVIKFRRRHHPPVDLWQADACVGKNIDAVPPGFQILYDLRHTGRGMHIVFIPVPEALYSEAFVFFCAEALQYRPEGALLWNEARVQLQPFLGTEQDVMHLADQLRIGRILLCHQIRIIVYKDISHIEHDIFIVKHSGMTPPFLSLIITEVPALQN